jgi:cytosine/adenosine deaminase-related metal-dependent hydrolase
MKKISADIIYDGLGNRYENYVLVLDSLNSVSGLIPNEMAGETSEILKVEGFICPGFINTHCHLELSHLKGLLKEKTGINNFLNQLVTLRAIEDEKIIENCIQWDKIMYQQGIVAIADICNTNHSIKAKKESEILYYNFIETFALDPSKSEHAIAKAKSLLNEFRKTLNYNASITPHAPYSVSTKLFSMINENINHQNLISIHNQESQSENDFFTSKSGDMVKRLTEWGIDLSELKASGRSSLQSYLKNIKRENNLLLVHNTFTNQSDIDFIKEHRINTYIALCPNANLFIENTLPKIELLEKSGLTLCIGTDSLASNYDLNIWSELQTIQHAYPLIKTETLINWACLNGAKFLNIDNKYGSFENKKTPGVVSIYLNKITKIV